MEDTALNEVLEELKKNTKNPELVKDNKFYFFYKDIWYRVRMPNQKELTEASQYRNKIRIQLLQKGKKEGFLLKKDLIAVLKQNDIDIEEMEKEIAGLKKEFVQVCLTASKKKDGEKELLLKLEKEANEIESRMKIVINKKAEYLAPAIEYQSEDGWYKLLTACCTEMSQDEKQEKWEKVWKTFDDFQKDETVLPYLAEAHFGALSQND